MHRTLRLLSCLALAALPACLGPSGQSLSASEYREMERLTAAREPSASSVEGAEKARRSLDDRSRQLDDRRADHSHNTASLAGRVTRTDLEHATALADETLALSAAQRELVLAQEDLAHFKTVLMDRRIRASELTLQSSEHGLLETREELAQLELMYGASELGDSTAEIVLERTRRRLMLSELRHKLRVQEAAELKSRTLPRELAKLKTALVQKTVANENTKRRLDRQAMERAAATRDLEHEQRKLERETAAIGEEARLLDVDRRKWNREQDDARRAGTP